MGGGFVGGGFGGLGGVSVLPLSTVRQVLRALSQGGSISSAAKIVFCLFLLFSFFVCPLQFLISGLGINTLILMSGFLTSLFPVSGFRSLSKIYVTTGLPQDPLLKV